MEDETKGIQEVERDYKLNMETVEEQLNNLIEQHRIYFAHVGINTDDLRGSIKSGNIEGLCAALSFLHEQIRKHGDDRTQEVDAQIIAIILLLNPDYTEPVDLDEKEIFQEERSLYDLEEDNRLGNRIKNYAAVFCSVIILVILLIVVVVVAAES